MSHARTSPIDLNADLGEGIGADDAMLDIVTSASIACGGHAGDERSILAAVESAHARGVRIGAHLSYEDRDGFGRQAVDVDSATLGAQLARQLDLLLETAARTGAGVAYIKPHGALYHRVAADPAHAEPVLALAAEHRLALMGLPETFVVHEARRRGLAVLAESFADRAYLPDGRLVPRDQEGAVLHDPDLIAARCVEMVRTGTVAAITGERIGVHADSICVHGDTPGAVRIARTVRTALQAAGLDLSV